MIPLSTPSFPLFSLANIFNVGLAAGFREDGGGGRADPGQPGRPGLQPGPLNRRPRQPHSTADPQEQISALRVLFEKMEKVTTR
jgi:hypothetical protein